MDQRSPTFEATLLHKTAPTQNLDRMIEDVSEILRGYEERIIRLEKIDAIYYLLSCRRIKILLALSTDVLPLGGMETAQRPDTATLRDRHIQDRLLQSNSSTTILVLERDPDLALYTENTAHMMRDICRDVADIVVTHTKADLVFWADTETLFGAEEFSNGYTVAQSHSESATATHEEDADGAKRKAPYIFEDPIVAGAMQDWIRGTSKDSAEPSSERYTKKRPGFFNWFKMATGHAVPASGSL